MITSTPMLNKNNSLRKSVLLKNVEADNPLRKRLSNITNQSSFLEESNINDNLERSVRRSEAELQKRVSNISSSSPGSPNNYSDKEMSTYVQNCIKMFTENKINTKNAWTLKIIDFTRKLLQLAELPKDSLQVGGASLDVSTKVYEIRVDDVHSIGLKLAIEMAKTNSKKRQGGVENEDEDEAGDVEDAEEHGSKKKKKKKSKALGQRQTVCKDPDTLLENVKKLDSVFFQTRSSVLADSTLNRIPLNCSCYKYMLQSQEIAWATADKKDNRLKSETLFDFSCPEINLDICPSIAHIHIDEWDPEKEIELMNREKSLTNEVVYDDQGFPIAELDGSIHDIFANDVENDCEHSEEEEEVNIISENALNSVEPAHVVDIIPENSNLSSNDYSYLWSVHLMSNKRLTQMWAGPSHWKLRYVRSKSSRFSGQQELQAPEKRKQKKARYQAELIDMEQNIPNEDKTKTVKVRRFKINEDPLRLTLPELQETEMNKVRSLITKVLYLTTHKKEEINTIDSDVQTYNYENLNDSQYCSQNNVPDNDDIDPMDDNGADSQTEEFPPTCQSDNLENNLVEIPEMVQKTTVPYAMRAKRMDMKVLKTEVWKSLVSSQPIENIPTEGMYERKVQPSQFSDLYKNLPLRLSEKMRNELSRPLAFVAMLHLCNEQNLKLTGQVDLKDFKIEQDGQ